MALIGNLEYTKKHMAKLILDDNFKSYLLTSYSLEENQLERVLEELGEYFARDMKDFIAHRHQELHQSGLKNETIYRMIQNELPGKRFASPRLSVRQIRRIIYG